MKKAEFVRMIMLAGMIAAACTPKQNTIVPAAQVAQSSAVAGAPQPAIEPGSLEDFRANVGDTVRFAYDGYTLDDQARVTLEKQADWLARYPVVTLSIEGHCDERGTREYNLALGARRANAIREYLISRGLAQARLQTVSYGKERPICSAASEDCWGQNRRGVSVISRNGAS